MLSIDDKIESLKNTELFKDVSEDALKKIAAITQEISMEDDGTLFQEGDKGDAIYFIIHGQMVAHREGVDLAILRASECVGEMAVIDGGPRSASVSSIGNTLLLKIDRDDFYRILQDDVNLLQNSLKIILKKLREHTVKEVNAVRIQARTEQDLLRARELQMSMIPKKDLHYSIDGCPPIRASGCCYPASKVGGDYYDYFILPDKELGLVIGDVMGHGFHTGLLVAMAKSCLQTQMKSDYSIPKVMESMNDMVYGFAEDGLYMTFFYMILNLEKHTISFSNAGHLYPYQYVKRKKELQPMESDACPLGIKRSQNYQISQLEWDEGDVFVLYTDGITEARNEKDQEFCEERLKELIIKNAELPAHKLKEKILQIYHDFCGNVNQVDDVSLVIVKVG